MPKTDTDPLGPYFGWRLRAELDRVQPPFSSPRYVQIHRVGAWRRQRAKSQSATPAAMAAPAPFFTHQAPSHHAPPPAIALLDLAPKSSPPTV